MAKNYLLFMKEKQILKSQLGNTSYPVEWPELGKPTSYTSGGEIRATGMLMHPEVYCKEMGRLLWETTGKFLIEANTYLP
jgi:hypothetical protein